MNFFLLRLWKALPFSKDIRIALMRILQDQFLVGVTGVIFNEYDEVLLFKHTYRSVPWSLPGGYIKGKEHPREGLEREIEEESGLIVSLEDRLKIRTDRETARLDISYMGSFLGGVFRVSDEVSEYGFFRFSQLPLIPKSQPLLIQQALETKKSHLPVVVTTLNQQEGERNMFQKMQHFLSS